MGLPFDMQILTFNLAISSSVGKFYNIQNEPAIYEIEEDVVLKATIFNQNCTLADNL